MTRALAASAALWVTVWGDLAGARSALPLARLAQAAAPGDLGVCVHDPPGDDERALVDLVRRPAEQVRGRKAIWAVGLLVQPFGPIAYLGWGARRPASA